MRLLLSAFSHSSLGSKDLSGAIKAYVQDFSSKERQEIDIAIQESIAIVDAIFKHGLERAISGMR